MTNMNIVYFCTSEFGNAKNSAIIRELAEKHSIKAVVTTPDSKVGRKQELTESPICVYARELGLSVLKPDSIKNNQAFFDQLRLFNADLFVVVAYGKILPNELLDMPKYKSINIHPSLLPKYRGPSPIPFAIMNGETKTGTTIMLMDAETDHGPILAQEELPIDPNDTFLTLSEKLDAMSAPLLITTIGLYISGEFKPVEQDHSQATFTKIFTKDDGKIDWNKPAQEIYNQYRALIPWPGLWTTWNDQILKITDCAIPPSPEEERVPEGRERLTPGTVIDGGQVVCGAGSTLQINGLQLAGKSETDI